MTSLSGVCALEIQQALQKLSEEHDLKAHLHTGIAREEVLAGVIGNNKFSYDMWEKQ